jgi:hypothetical protein
MDVSCYGNSICNHPDNYNYIRISMLSNLLHNIKSCYSIIGNNYFFIMRWTSIQRHIIKKILAMIPLINVFWLS